MREQDKVNYDLGMRDLKADIFGECFKCSAEDGYDSEKFISTVMTNPELENLVYIDERQEWSCGIELLINIERRVNLVKSRYQYDEYTLWFMGYLYKYWMRTTGEKPIDIFIQLPVKNFLNAFGHYHTQGWDYIIEDAKKMHSRGEW